MKIENNWIIITDDSLPPLNKWVVCELENVSYGNLIPYNVLKRITYGFEPGWRWFGSITGKPAKWKKI